MIGTAENYADALFELARSESLEDQLLPQLTGAERLFAQNPDYYRLLDAANVPLSERLSALDEAFSGRVHTYLLSFLKLLCERGRIRDLPACERRFRKRYNAEHGIIEATAVTAIPLRPELQKKLSDRLAGLTGKQVDLRNRVDPSVLGGIRLEYEGRELDGTVRQRLDGISKTLSETVL